MAAPKLDRSTLKELIAQQHAAIRPQLLNDSQRADLGKLASPDKTIQGSTARKLQKVIAAAEMTQTPLGYSPEFRKLIDLTADYRGYQQTPAHRCAAYPAQAGALLSALPGMLLGSLGGAVTGKGRYGKTVENGVRGSEVGCGAGVSVGAVLGTVVSAPLWGPIYGVELCLGRRNPVPFMSGISDTLSKTTRVFDDAPVPAIAPAS